MGARFLQMSDVAEELSVSLSQVYHMVRSGERTKLEEYIERKYGETADWVRNNPLAAKDDEPE
jgi:hypothetical protein